MNSLKWALVFTLAVSGVVANYQFSSQPLIVRVIGLLFLTAVILIVSLQTDKGRQFLNFAIDAKNELRKVIWPTRKETIQTTLIVMLMVSVVGILLWGLDTVLLKVIAWITGYGAV